MHPLIEAALKDFDSKKDKVIEEIENLIAEKLFHSRLREWNNEFGTRRPLRSDKKDIIILDKDKNELFIIAKDLCPIVSFNSKASALVRFEVLMEHEKIIKEQAKHYSDLISNNRMSLHQGLRSFCSTRPNVTFSTKPSRWILGTDNGNEYVEISYKQRYLCDIQVNLLDGYAFDENPINKILEQKTTKIDMELQQEESQRLWKRQLKYKNLFSSIDSRKMLSQDASLPTDKPLDILGGKISPAFNVDDSKLVNEAFAVYQGYIDIILHNEKLTSICGIPPQSLSLSPRYFFRISHTHIHKGDVYHLYECRGEKINILFHVFKNGEKTKSYLSKANALRSMGLLRKRVALQPKEYIVRTP